MCRERPVTVCLLGAILTATILLASAPRLGLTKEPAKPADTKPTQPEDIRQKDPGFLVRVDVNRGTRSYQEGDSLYAQVTSEADAYVYVLYKQADGKIFQIFPNSEQSDNRVKARQTVRIPASEDLFRWVIGPPFGKEILKVIASKEPLDVLSDLAMREKFFNPVSPTQTKNIELEVGKEDLAWAEDMVEITTYPRGQIADAPQGRRYGVFVGVGEYEFISKTSKQADGKVVVEALPCHRDAQRLAAVLREVGQLTDLRTYTNDQATRKNVEEAITRWLPAVSRPGDTVLIYFSGMSDTVSDAQDPKTAQTLLLPHDFMPLSIAVELAKKRLPQYLAQRVMATEEVAKRAGSKQKAAIAVARSSGVPGYLMAHWLQALAGRQVVVILDTDFAAGVLPGSPPPSTKGATVNVLSGEVNRLKGLGQQEIALLGATGEPLKDVLRGEAMSLMTLCLVRSIAAAPGALTLEQAHKAVAAAMEEMFEEANRQRLAEGKEPVKMHKPYLINTCTRPVMLKP